MTATRILYLCRMYPYPPAYGGDVTYNRSIIENLGRHAEVRVVCASNGEIAPGRFRKDGIDWQIAGRVRDGKVGAMLSRWPHIAWRGADPTLVAAVRAALEEKWDAIVLDNIGSVHLLPLARAHAARNPGTRIAYVSHEHEASVRVAKYARYGGNPLLRLAMAWDGHKVVAAERRMVREVDLVSVINPEDIALYRADAPDARFHVLLPGYEGAVTETRHIDASVPRRVVVLGGRGPKQKQMVLVDWLEISAERLAKAGIETCVVGPMDDDLKAELSAKVPSVRFMGFVDDLAAFLATCRLGIVPDTVGGGFKLRLLSYVFHRVPIVGLTGAVSGLPVAPGEGFLEAPSLAALVDLIVSVVDDTDRLDALQTTAFDACHGRFDWNARGRAFAEALVAPLPQGG